MILIWPFEGCPHRKITFPSVNLLLCVPDTLLDNMVYKYLYPRNKMDVIGSTYYKRYDKYLFK